MRADPDPSRVDAPDDTAFVGRLRAVWRPPELDDVQRRSFDARLRMRLAERGPRRGTLVPAMGIAAAALATIVWLGLPAGPTGGGGPGGGAIARGPGVAPASAPTPTEAAATRAGWERQLFYADPAGPVDLEPDGEGSLPAEYAAIGSLLLDG